MKTTERYIALVLEHSEVTAVEIAHSPKGFTLTAAGSFASSMNFDDQEIFMQPRSVQRERAFVQELAPFLRKIGSGSRFFSFGLNSRMVLLQMFPLDTTLSESDIEQHAQWELAQHYTNASPISFAISTQMLDTHSEAEVASTVMVSVRKAFVSFLTNVAVLLGGSLHIVDVDHFGAENALAFNYPEIREKRIIVAGLDENSFDASLMVQGQTKDIVTMELSGDGTIGPLVEYASNAKAETIFLHGRILTPELVSTLQEMVSVPVEVIDPFRKVSLPHSLANYDEISERRQAFASAVGLALRSE
jgi:Tfp pilus assembly PilM family ATPase